jgi:hypothetical protein
MPFKQAFFNFFGRFLRIFLEDFYGLLPLMGGFRRFWLDFGRYIEL